MYLLAGVYAALSMPLWALQYLGWLPGADPLWHAHEMLFGYAFAVIAGFLLTAVRNWTGLGTPAGAPLAAIASLWLLARAGLLLAAGSGARRRGLRARGGLGHRPAAHPEPQP